MEIRKVSAAILVKNGKILIQNRIGFAKHSEEWSFFGGGIENSETPKEALFREVKEELNLEIENWEILEGPEIIQIFPEINREAHRFLFLIKIPEEITKFTDYECGGAEFFEIEELKNLKFFGDRTREIEFIRENINF